MDLQVLLHPREPEYIEKSIVYTAASSIDSSRHPSTLAIRYQSLELAEAIQQLHVETDLKIVALLEEQYAASKGAAARRAVQVDLEHLHWQLSQIT